MSIAMYVMYVYCQTSRQHAILQPSLHPSLQPSLQPSKPQALNPLDACLFVVFCLFLVVR